ncbi:hypothetical protein ACFSTC_32825 [Nonomuraea ferruginea]
MWRRPADGTWRDVERLLDGPRMRAEGLDGSDVHVAVVDTGVNLDHLSGKLGRDVRLDAGRSWLPPTVPGKPGEFPVDHGTMCAFDALIGAPAATLLDLPLLRSTRPGGSVMDGLLSDAVAAFAHLRGVLDAQPEESRALVVNNSWGGRSPRSGTSRWGIRATTPTTGRTRST